MQSAKIAYNVLGFAFVWAIATVSPNKDMKLNRKAKAGNVHVSPHDAKPVLIALLLYYPNVASLVKIVSSKFKSVINNSFTFRVTSIRFTVAGLRLTCL